MTNDEPAGLVAEQMPRSAPGGQRMVPNTSKVLMSEELVDVIDEGVLVNDTPYLISVLKFTHREEPVVGSVINIQVSGCDINIEIRTDMEDAMWLLESALGTFGSHVSLTIDSMKIERNGSSLELGGPLNVSTVQSVTTSGPSADGFCILLLAIKRLALTTDVDLNT